MIFSKSCNYAIRAVIYMAAQTDRKWVTIREIADQVGIPYHYLTKIFQVLNRDSITVSCKGPKGGVAFARPASLITLAEIIYAFKELDILQDCLFGFEQCSNKNPCPMHLHWENIGTQLKSKLEKTSLSDIADRIQKDNQNIIPGILH